MAKTKEKDYVNEQGTDLNAAAGTRQHIPFAIVEAYKTIRTNLQFLLSGKKCKKVVISSCVSGEGKSTTAVNLSIAFAQTGSKVLLIDADLRRPSINKKLKVQNTKGLSSALVGFCEAEEAISNVNPYFDVLTSGPIPPNPSELLGGEKMDELLQQLSEKYDYIFIDMPPVNVVSDPLVLANKTDGIVFIVQDNVTTHEEFQKALSSIEFAKVKLLGVVMNGTNRSKRTKYRYRYMTEGKYNGMYAYSAHGGK